MTGASSDDDGTLDRELLRRHLAGEPTAFTEIVHRHRDHLWAVALRTTGDPEDAADALQDALISAMRHADSFRGDAKLSTWLHRIVVNACLDRLRKRSAHLTVALPDDDHTPADPRDDFADREVVADVQAALATLSPDQRAAIVLVDIEGYPVEEAAAMLSCPVGTVKSRCARGRARLVPLLRHLRDDPRSGDPRSGDPGGGELASGELAASAGNAIEPDGVEPAMRPPREELR